MPLTMADLLPDPNNPRTITPRAQAGLQASLRLGDVNFAWNRRTGEMISGHQRLDALRAEAARRGVELAVSEVDQDLAELVVPAGPGGGEKDRELRFALRIHDVDRITQTAMNLTANNPDIQGEFTDDVAELVKLVADTTPDVVDDLDLGGLLRMSEAPMPTDGRAETGAVQDKKKEAIAEPSKPAHSCPACGHVW